jgi:hypothetical protein
MNNNTETTEQGLTDKCFSVLDYLYPNCQKEMSYVQFENAINSLKSIANFQKEQDEAKYKALLDSHNELLECLKLAYDQINISQKQIPLSKQFNLKTEKGKECWEIFSSKMVRIETAINKAKNI